MQSSSSTFSKVGSEFVLWIRFNINCLTRIYFWFLVLFYMSNLLRYPRDN